MRNCLGMLRLRSLTASIDSTCSRGSLLFLLKVSYNAFSQKQVLFLVASCDYGLTAIGFRV